MRFRILHSALILLAVLVTGVATGCGGDTTIGSEDDSDQVLRSNDPAGRNYTLTSYLWRDFMPAIGDDDMHTSLSAAVKISASDSQPLPATLTADRIWIISGDEVWESAFSDEPRPMSDYAFECVARGGPLWEIDITVDVKVRMSNNGTEFYLEAKDVVIHRTD